jgi:hypothetical protein
MENKQYPFDVKNLVDLGSERTIGYRTEGNYPKIRFIIKE